jgi:hypothetical protein
MGLLLNAPKRYEDITGGRLWRLGPIQKLRLLWFLADRPEEAERFLEAKRADLCGQIGTSRAPICVAPREEIRKLRRQKRALRAELRWAKQDKQELLRENRDLLDLAKRRKWSLDKARPLGN